MQQSYARLLVELSVTMWILVDEVGERKLEVG